MHSYVCRLRMGIMCVCMTMCESVYITVCMSVCIEMFANEYMCESALVSVICACVNVSERERGGGESVS